MENIMSDLRQQSLLRRIQNRIQKEHSIEIIKKYHSIIKIALFFKIQKE